MPTEPTHPSYPTLLGMVGIEYPNDAVRGLSVTVRPIDRGGLEYDANGLLMDLTLPQFRKLAVTVICNDMNAPKLVNVWRGTAVLLTLIYGLGQEEDSDTPLTINCLVDSYSASREEYPAKSNWTLELLEI